VFWHGNGEIASDYDDVVAYFHRAGAALLVIDFRGYGWSSGQPGVDELLHDAEAVCPLLAGVVGERPLYAMGRSMGGAAAIQAVYRNPNTFRGLILESTFAGIVPVVKRIVAIPMVTGILNEPLDSVGKMPHITLPLRIIHGEADSLIPVEHAHQLYNAAGSTDKRLVTIPRAGHNDIMMRDMRLYFDTIQAFVGSG
jgi:alpha-beta hydrolase superfamily lysophospholipase